MAIIYLKKLKPTPLTEASPQVGLSHTGQVLLEHERRFFLQGSIMDSRIQSERDRHSKRDNMEGNLSAMTARPIIVVAPAIHYAVGKPRTFRSCLERQLQARYRARRLRPDRPARARCRRSRGPPTGVSWSASISMAVSSPIKRPSLTISSTRRIARRAASGLMRQDNDLVAIESADATANFKRHFQAIWSRGELGNDRHP